MPNDLGLLVPSVDRGLVDVALTGLSRPQKALPAKLFYDEEGCRLFYRITALPEYYLTRTESALLPEVAPLVLESIPAGSVLVEYGASDEGKASYLLQPGTGDLASPISAYVPIDVAMPALRQMRERLATSHRQLAVYPIAMDFMDPVTLPTSVASMPRLGFFPGSTIGNLDPEKPAVSLPWRATRSDCAHVSLWAPICTRTRLYCCRPTTMPPVSPPLSIATSWYASIVKPRPTSRLRCSRTAPCGTTRKAALRCIW